MTRTTSHFTAGHITASLCGPNIRPPEADAIIQVSFRIAQRNILGSCRLLLHFALTPSGIGIQCQANIIANRIQCVDGAATIT